MVGNINAGKSFLVKKLKKKFEDYPVLSIDDYRMVYGDGSIQKEVELRKIFANDILSKKNAIIEFSGGETISSLFIDKIRDNSVIVFELHEKADLCIERIKFKDFSKIPYPKFEEKITETIKRLDNEFKENMINNNFKNKIIKKYKFNTYYDLLEELPLKQYEILIKLVDAFEGKYNNLYAFGSLGSGTININSDIDLFLITEKSIEEVVKDLKPLFKDAEYIVQKNQIAVFVEDQLLEINVIKSVFDSQLYYLKSEIKNVEKTVLLGGEKLINSLNNIIANKQDDFLDEFDYTIARLKYYTKSLERIIKKNDRYKFYFHNNIVIHEIVRLKYFMSGERKFNYLPKYVDKYIELNTIKSLQFDLKDNMVKHVEVIKEIVDNVLKDATDYRKNWK